MLLPCHKPFPTPTRNTSETLLRFLWLNWETSKQIYILILLLQDLITFLYVLVGYPLTFTSMIRSPFLLVYLWSSFSYLIANNFSLFLLLNMAASYLLAQLFFWCFHLTCKEQIVIMFCHFLFVSWLICSLCCFKSNHSLLPFARKPPLLFVGTKKSGSPTAYRFTPGSASYFSTGSFPVHSVLILLAFLGLMRFSWVVLWVWP